MKQLISIFFITFILVQNVNSQIISQWRGNNRNGIYDETNLLKKWPIDGPELIWFNDSIPKGYSSPAIDENLIYVTGIVDSTDNLIAINFEGNIVWQTSYGKAWMNSFSDSRSTPTIDGDFIYVTSGSGYVTCVNKQNGEIIWKVNAFEKYEGKSVLYAIRDKTKFKFRNQYCPK